MPFSLVFLPGVLIISKNMGVKEETICRRGLTVLGRSTEEVVHASYDVLSRVEECNYSV